MWNIFKPILGVLLILGALNGARQMIAGDGQAGRDMEAIGTIISLDANTIRITRLAKKTDHYIKYSFVAHDGKTYTKSYSISPQEFTSLREGQRVKIHYHSNNPSINAIPALRSYTTVAEIRSLSPSNYPILRAIFLVVSAVIGTFLVWGAVSGLLPASSGSAVSGRGAASTASIPANRLASAARSRPTTFGRSG